MSLLILGDLDHDYALGASEFPACISHHSAVRTKANLAHLCLQDGVVLRRLGLAHGPLSRNTATPDYANSCLTAAAGDIAKDLGKPDAIFMKDSDLDLILRSHHLRRRAMLVLQELRERLSADVPFYIVPSRSASDKPEAIRLSSLIARISH